MESREGLDKTIYNKFVRNVGIESVALNNLVIKGASDGFDGSDQLIADLEFRNEKFSFNKDVLIVNPSFILNVSTMKDDKKNTVFEIKFEYKLEYRAEGCSEIEMNYLRLFVERNIPINVWPYARELISSMTTRMGYPALIIEPFRG